MLIILVLLFEQSLLNYFKAEAYWLKAPLWYALPSCFRKIKFVPWSVLKKETITIQTQLILGLTLKAFRYPQCSSKLVSSVIQTKLIILQIVEFCCSVKLPIIKLGMAKTL